MSINVFTKLSGVFVCFLLVSFVCRRLLSEHIWRQGSRCIITRESAAVAASAITWRVCRLPMCLTPSGNLLSCPMPSLHVPLSVCLSVSVSLSLYLTVCLSLSLSFPLSPFLSLSLSPVHEHAHTHTNIAYTCSCATQRWFVISSKERLSDSDIVSEKQRCATQIHSL